MAEALPVAEADAVYSTAKDFDYPAPTSFTRVTTWMCSKDCSRQ